MQYSVAMVHHGKTLHCQSVKLNRSVSSKCRLFFSWLGRDNLSNKILIRFNKEEWEICPIKVNSLMTVS